MVKKLPANARDIRDVGLSPGSGRSLEEKMAAHSSILAWDNPMDRRAWQGYTPWSANLDFSQARILGWAASRKYI